MINTTSLRPPKSQNTSSSTSISPINDASTRRKSTSDLKKHPTLQPQCAGRGWRLFHVRPWMEDGLRHSVFLSDHSLRHRRSNSTRRRGGIGGEGDGPLHRTTTPPHREHNLRKSSYRITRLLPTPHKAQNRSFRHITHCHLHSPPTSRHIIHAKDAVATPPVADGVLVVESEHGPGKHQRARLEHFKVLPLRSHRHSMQRITHKRLLQGAALRSGSSAIEVQIYRTKDWTGPTNQLQAATSTTTQETGADE